MQTDKHVDKMKFCWSHTYENKRRNLRNTKLPWHDMNDFDSVDNIDFTVST